MNITFWQLLKMRCHRKCLKAYKRRTNELRGNMVIVWRLENCSTNQYVDAARSKLKEVEVELGKAIEAVNIDDYKRRQK